MILWLTDYLAFEMSNKSLKLNNKYTFTSSAAVQRNSFYWCDTSMVKACLD